MSELRNTMFDLLSYKYLESGWDGYEAIKPLQSKISEAWKLLKIIVDNELPIPSVMISGASEIGFYWSKTTHGVYVEVEAHTGSVEEKWGMYFSYLVDEGENNFFGGEDLPIKDFKDSRLHEYFKDYMPKQELDVHDKYYFNLIFNKEGT